MAKYETARMLQGEFDHLSAAGPYPFLPLR